MMGEHLGKFYAEVFRSHRFHSTTLLEVREFSSREQMEKFIFEYNMEHLNFDITPEIYTMAQEASWYTIIDHIKKV